MIAVIDYGMGNLASVQKAILHVGGDARLITSPAELAGAEKIVLPGVAAFGQTIEQLREMGFVEPLKKAIEAGTPYLGICLGLQMLFDISYEDGEHTGLGIFPGKVVRFEFDPAEVAEDLAIPHMGWNKIHWDRDCPLYKGIDNDSYAYFAHSYHVVPAEPEVTATETDYGYKFTSSVWRGNIFGTQFHPEKSQDVGLAVLTNFVNL